MIPSTPPINSNRLADTFMQLVRIDSVSREEANLCAWLERRLGELGCDCVVDGAAGRVGGNTGNLIARFPGEKAMPPLLLSGHMDTVEPGRRVTPRLENGVFTSGGDTILGADDKSAIAIILEVLQSIRERQLSCAPLEVVFTVCEEIGLLGAKHLAYDELTARMGYVLDTRNPEAIITRAPAANRIVLQVHGKAAHAGASPEKGIDAIFLACKAIAGLQWGRIDEETTCNIGIIEGGLATNIVPETLRVKGEARSHDEGKLDEVTERIVSSFRRVLTEYGGPDAGGLPRLDVVVERDFERFCIDEQHPVVTMARRAAASTGMRMACAASGGGSDASVFTANGIVTGVLGTGMEGVHTTRESIRLDDMARSARLLLEMIRLYSEEEGCYRL